MTPPSFPILKVVQGTMQWQKFENLNYLSNTKDSAKTAIILFHGYGADATDLYPLERYYNFTLAVDWFFPQGVLQVPIGPMMTGRAWFEISQKQFENLSQRKVEDVPLGQRKIKLLDEVTRFLNHLGGMYDNVVIGGFSQGAILTSHSFYRLNFSPKALLLLSGFLFSPSEFPSLAKEQQIPFFQSHGQQDQILPIAGARQLFEHLQGKGLSGKWLEFSGGHEIPMQTITQSNSFLTSVLGLQE